MSAREGMAWAKDNLDKYSKLIVKLDAEQRMSATLALSRPPRGRDGSDT
jgi:hypothetical protein